MGRSGSTLFANLINCTSDFREIFEPFFPDKVEEAKPFVYPKYLPPDKNDKRYLKPAKKIFSGSLKNKWTDQSNANYASNRLLIKAIRSNLFLKWINAHFPEIEIILLMRNPFAVVKSWIAANFGDGQLGRERLLSQEDLVEDYLLPFKDEYLAINNTFLRLLFFWCIYYHIPLKQFDSKNITIVFYEHLITDTKAELALVNSRLSLDIDYQRANEVVKIPSHTTRKYGDIKRLGKIDLWSEGIETSIIDEAYRIMNLFSMDTFYGPNGMPNRDAVLEFLNT